MGLVWGLLIPSPALFLFGLLIGLGLGYAVGGAVSLATNRKVGPQLQVLAAGGVVLAYVVRTALLAAELPRFGFLDIVTDDLFGYIVVGLAVVVAIGRLR